MSKALARRSGSAMMHMRNRQRSVNHPVSQIQPHVEENRAKCEIFKTLCPYGTAVVVFLGCTGSIWGGPWFIKTFDDHIDIPVLTLLGITTVMSIVNFLYASCMNPGFLPKALENRYADSQPQTIEIQGTKIHLKMCRTCLYYRMPRTVHCSQCDYCVDTFDHHCPWVNNCVGRRNYRHFFAFISTLTVHILLCLSICLLFLFWEYAAQWDEQHIVILIVTVLTGVIFFPVAGLLGFHLFLMCRGLTTYEYVSTKYPDGNSPFDIGPCGNCAFQLCGPEFPIFEPLKPLLREDEQGPKLPIRELLYKMAQAAAAKGNSPTEDEDIVVKSFSKGVIPVFEIVSKKEMNENEDNLSNADCVSILVEDEINRIVSNIPSDIGSHLHPANDAAGGDRVKWEEPLEVSSGKEKDYSDSDIHDSLEELPHSPSH